MFESTGISGDTSVRVEGSGIGSTSMNSLYAGHLTTSNYLFADGHAKALKPAQTYIPVDLWHTNNPTTTNLPVSDFGTFLKNAIAKYN